jgi:P27 family predicted phage terminase small subunit
MAAPTPIPARIKMLRGNPGKQIIRPEVEAPRVTELPKAPAWLGEVGQAEWYRIVELLMQMGILSTVDLEALGGYCLAVEVRRKAVKEWRDDGCRVMIEHTNVRGDSYSIINPLVVAEREASKAVLRHAIEFGFTPAARARINPIAVGQKSKFGDLVEQSGDAQRRGQEARKASN